MPTLVTLVPTTSGSLSCSVGRTGQAVVWISLAMSENFLAMQPNRPSRTSGPGVDRSTSHRSTSRITRPPRGAVIIGPHQRQDHRSHRGPVETPSSRGSMSQPSPPRGERRARRPGDGSTTTCRPTALRLASICVISLVLGAPGESLTATCSGGTDLPASNFFAASGSPAGVSPRSGATKPGRSGGITESATEPIDLSAVGGLDALPVDGERDGMADIGILDRLVFIVMKSTHGPGPLTNRGLIAGSCALREVADREDSVQRDREGIVALALEEPRAGRGRVRRSVRIGSDRDRRVGWDRLRGPSSRCAPTTATCRVGSSRSCRVPKRRDDCRIPPWCPRPWAPARYRAAT